MKHGCAGNIFLDVTDEHTPYKTIKVRGEKTPWVTDEYIALTYERGHLKNRAENSGDSALWSQFKAKRNHINNLREELKTDYYQNQIAESSSNPSKLWKTLKNMLGKQRGSSKTVNLLNAKWPCPGKISLLSLF